MEFYFRFRFRPFHSNRRFIVRFTAEMTSYRFFKISAAAAQYYFRFPVCWCRCPQKVKIYLWTKFRRHSSIYGWDITTSGLERPPYWNSISGLSLDHFTVIGILFCIGTPNFVQIGPPTAEIMTIYRFSWWRPSAMLCCICCGVMADHPQSAIRGLNSVHKSLVRWINILGILRCIDFGVLSWICLFTPLLGEFLGEYFPIWRHLSPWPP